MLTAVAVAFAVLFWPQSLGGKVAYVRVDGHSMDPTFRTGDLAIVRKQSAYRIGDPVAYRIPRGEFGAGALVIHRLIGGNGTTGFVTKGDNRTIADEWHPRTSDVVGQVRYDIPAAGNRLATLTQPMYLGGLVAGLTVLVMLIPSGRRPEPRALQNYPNESYSLDESRREIVTDVLTRSTP
jgi:signal peptidase